MTAVGAGVILVLAVLVGTVLQRLSGTGVGLVIAPVLAILLGPAFGVLVTNMTTVVSGFLIMLSVWASIDWRRFWRIIPAAVLGSIPGAWVVGQLPAGWLSIILGCIVVLALLVTVTVRRVPSWTGRVPAATAGLLGGFFNATSGVAAPVMVMYSRVSRWEQTPFAATMQPVFMVMGAASLLSKLLLGSVDTGRDHGLSLGWLVPGIVLTVLLGIVVGGRLSRRVPLPVARTIVLVLAGLGGLGAVVRGAVEVLG